MGTNPLTEAKWGAGKLLAPLLHHLARHFPLSDRKLRLFACACCRRQWKHLSDPRSRAAAEVAEAFADAAATSASCLHATQDAWAAARAAAAAGGYDFDWEVRKAGAALFDRGRAAGFRWAVAAAFTAAGDAGLAARVAEGVSNMSELAAGCALLRCIAGNPFRPVVFDIAWRTGTAVAIAIARQMYDARDFAAMPILADALQDAGCDDPDVLSHCREPGEHARGCWVVDAVLSLS